MPDLERFVVAQEGGYQQIVAELTAGRKTSHWMWYVFPQLEGLGRSSIARMYGIKSLDEAQAYDAHPVLGPRLHECTTLVNNTSNRSLEAIFGPIDAMKFRSCMTLFAEAAPDNAVFRAALDKYCDGRGDEKTIELLRQ